MDVVVIVALHITEMLEQGLTAISEPAGSKQLTLVPWEKRRE